MSTQGLRRPSRRSVVAALALAPAAMAAGCTLPAERSPETSGTPTSRRSSTEPAEPTEVDADLDADAEPDVALVAAAGRTVTHLVAAYTATLRRHRELRPALAPMLDRHRSHAQVLAGVVTEPDDDVGASGPPPERIRVPPRTRSAVAALRAAEDDARLAHLQQTGSAQSGALARLLASLAASEAQHVALLAAGAGDLR